MDGQWRSEGGGRTAPGGRFLRAEFRGSSIVKVWAGELARGGKKLARTFFLGLSCLLGGAARTQGREILVAELYFPSFKYPKFSFHAKGAAKMYSAPGGTRARYATVNGFTGAIQDRMRADIRAKFVIYAGWR
jgi:hypothetical protein